MQMSPRFFFLITDKCNLNCVSCMHGCDEIQNHYYISLEDMEQSLKILKEKNIKLNNQSINDMEWIAITGGDPLMHPQLYEICLLIKKYFPNIGIDIYTNGLLLDTLSDEDLINYAKLKARFSMSIYANINQLNNCKKQIKRASQLKISMFICMSHLYFSKQTISNNKIKNLSNTAEEYFINNECTRHLEKDNFITIYKNRIYPCCKNLYTVNCGNNLFENDSLFLKDIKENYDLKNLFLKSSNLCQYCINFQQSNEYVGDAYLLWQPKSKNAYNLKNQSLCDIYVNDYALYNNLLNNSKNHYKCIQDPWFFTHFNDHNQLEFHKGTTKFLESYGLLDIYIPFTTSIPKDIKEKLLQQSIANKCNFYFCSINASPDVEKETYLSFLPDYDINLNSFFLKGTSFLSGYNNFLNDSYLTHKIILDVFDKTTQNKLQNSKYLEELIYEQKSI